MAGATIAITVTDTIHRRLRGIARHHRRPIGRHRRPGISHHQIMEGRQTAEGNHQTVARPPTMADVRLMVAANRQAAVAEVSLPAAAEAASLPAAAANHLAEAVASLRVGAAANHQVNN
jgi:hypothetical protein